MMYRVSKLFKLPIVILISLSLVGCATIPKDFLKLSPDSLKNRELQTRQFDATNEEEIIAACAGVLQDLGYTLQDSETKLGLVVADKDRDATDAGQVAFATVATILSALKESPNLRYSVIYTYFLVLSKFITNINNRFKV